MRKLTTCVAAAAAGALLAVSASTARAADADGWQRTHTDPFEFAAGALCPFGLKGDILYDNEFTRSYQSGATRIEEFTGPLGIRFGNVTTGKTVDRDVTGFIRVLHQPDGSREFDLWGDSVAPIFPGTGQAGDYVTHGHFVLMVHADRSREYTVRQGTSEDVCKTLA
jgi:hypothetical protein